MNNLQIFDPGMEMEKLRKPIRVLGIDLGTTNSTATEILWDPNSPEPAKVNILEIDQETTDGVFTSMLVSSFVGIHNGKIFVGEGAKRLLAKSPDLNLRKGKNLFYECKNEIGINKTYHQAPEGFRSAAEIGGKILKFIKDEAMNLDDTPIDRVVVTVPASFQLAQRNDTLKAARLAGFDVRGGDLLDEPVAAFIDFMMKKGREFLEKLAESKKVLVFDFGGGTCDVAIFEIQRKHPDMPLDISPLSVSRYHRLGGGDIDRAVIYEALIPQLMEQNNLNKFDLSFDDKKNGVEPALLNVAEALKINICKDIDRLMAFGKYEGADKADIENSLPNSVECKIKNEKYFLNKPRLNAMEFEKIMEDFLETDFLYPEETEYRTTCSIFAPLQDALDRCSMEADEIDICLMVGGSSLNPLLREPMENFFENGEIFFDKDMESVQAGVSRGAAHHAFALEAFGAGLVRTVCHDDICINTASGPHVIIPKGKSLPYPSGDSYEVYNNLAVPQTALFDPVELRIEILGGEDHAVLYRKVFPIKEMVNMGDPLCLEYRMDENQILDMKLYLEKQPDVEIFSEKIENPLTNVVNPASKIMEILRLEEKLRKQEIPRHLIGEKIYELGKLYSELGQREKAMEFLKKALKAKNDDIEILNRMGIVAGEMGDYEREEKYYGRAIKLSRCSAPLFNLTHSLMNRGKYQEASERTGELIKKERTSPHLILAAEVEEKSGNHDVSVKLLEEAMKISGHPSTMSDWEMGWCLAGAGMLGDNDKVSELNAEKKRRKMQDRYSDYDKGHLPATSFKPERV